MLAVLGHGFRDWLIDYKSDIVTWLAIASFMLMIFTAWYSFRTLDRKVSAIAKKLGLQLHPLSGEDLRPQPSDSD